MGEDWKLEEETESWCLMFGMSPLPTELLDILKEEEWHSFLFQVESSLSTGLWQEVTGFLNLKFSASLPILVVKLRFHW